jgi:alkanesulfonate monooxygenase SsuD/methylene tetrahydromethanopterin reductase-like flavin-dependent oxidoreductase (luciferase family)
MIDYYYFSEMPYPETPELDQYPSIRLTYPNKYFNPEMGVQLYRRYICEYAYAETVGFDGLMVNEHHNTPTCMHMSANITAAALIQRTRTAKILLLGNVIALWENPVRLAEEVAMLDLMSGGRVISGFVRGIGIEQFSMNLAPALNRERFQESHDLILKIWSEPGPFRWEGKHFEFRYVNPWISPVQRPHPPIWIPGIGSTESIKWAARHHYPYVSFLAPMDMAEQWFDLYRETADKEAGYTATPENLGYMTGCFVADTDAEARKSYEHFLWRTQVSLKGPMNYYMPVGMTTRGTNSILTGGSGGQKRKPVFQMTIDDLREAGGFVVGTPKEVVQRLKEIITRLGVGHMLFEGQYGGLPHDLTMHSIELMGKEVLPALRKELAGK